MPRGYRLAPEKRAEIERLLLEGNAYSFVAERVGVPYTTVATIAVGVREKIGENRYNYVHLVSEYLTEAMNVQIAQVRLLADQAWLHSQNAKDVAILHGVLTDKTLRLLELLTSSTAKAEDDEGEGTTVVDAIPRKLAAGDGLRGADG